MIEVKGIDSLRNVTSWHMDEYGGGVVEPWVDGNWQGDIRYG